MGRRRGATPGSPPLGILLRVVVTADERSSSSASSLLPRLGAQRGCRPMAIALRAALAAPIPTRTARKTFVDYIEVLPRDPLLTKTRKSGKNSKSLTRLIVYNAEGRPHMRLDDRGTCVALRGTLGVRVQCTIYPDRPTGCRRVVAGSERCLLARRERGVVDVL